MHSAIVFYSDPLSEIPAVPRPLVVFVPVWKRHLCLSFTHTKHLQENSSAIIFALHSKHSNPNDLLKSLETVACRVCYYKNLRINPVYGQDCKYLDKSYRNKKLLSAAGQTCGNAKTCQLPHCTNVSKVAVWQIRSYWHGDVLCVSLLVHCVFTAYLSRQRWMKQPRSGATSVGNAAKLNVQMFSNIL